MTTVEIIRSARELIEHGGRCRGAEATDIAGQRVHPLDPRAEFFSITGAVYRAIEYDGSPDSRRRLNEAVATVQQFAPMPLQKWNDAPDTDLLDIHEAMKAAEAMAILEATKEASDGK